MKSSRYIPVSLLLVFLSLTVLAADSYRIDSVHSSIGFSVRHMAVSNVRGSFRSFSGTIVFDPKFLDRCGAKVTVKTASIDTANPDRDRHLTSPDFLDSEHFPEMVFTSNRVEHHGQDWLLHGVLVLHGVSRQISIPFRILGPVRDPSGVPRIGISASFRIDRKDYGITWSRVMDTGGLLVGDEVEVQLEVEAMGERP